MHSPDTAWPGERIWNGYQNRDEQLNKFGPKHWMGSLVYSGADASGLLYRRNRYYDPVAGQFTQEDPIGLAGGLNLYGYANGDPVNLSDPFGLCHPFPTCLLEEGGPKQALLSVGNAFASVMSGLDRVLGGLGRDAVLVADGRDPSTGEQVGTGRRILAGTSLAGAASGPLFTPGQLAKFERQLAEEGLTKVLKSRRSIQRNLARERRNLQEYRATGGFTSSVEREIRNFTGELAAIDEVIKGVNR